VTTLGVCSVAGGLKEIFWYFSELQTEVIIVGVVKMTVGSSKYAGCVSTNLIVPPCILIY